MAKGYIYNENGELELSVDGGEMMWCERCQEVTYHAFVAISSVRGHFYACEQCGFEISGE